MQAQVEGVEVIAALSQEWLQAGATRDAAFKRLQAACAADPQAALAFIGGQTPKRGDWDSRMAMMDLLIPAEGREDLRKHPRFNSLREMATAFLVKADFVCFGDPKDCAERLGEIVADRIPHRHSFNLKELAHFLDPPRGAST